MSELKEWGSVTKYVNRRRLKLAVHTRAGILSAALDAKDIQRLCHVSEGQAYRWISGKSAIPKSMLELLQIKALGLIPDPRYDGFRVVDGVLWTDTDACFPLEALNDFKRVYQEAREFRLMLCPPRHEKEVQPDLSDNCRLPGSLAVPKIGGVLNS